MRRRQQPSAIANAAIKRFATELTAQWRDWAETSALDFAAIESAVRSFEEVLPQLATLPDEIVGARFDPDELASRALAKAVEAMPSVYRNDDPKDTESHLSRQFLLKLIRNAFRYLCTNREFVEEQAPQLWRSLFEVVDDTQLTVHRIEDKVDHSLQLVEQLLKKTKDPEARVGLERQVVRLKEQLRHDRDATARLLRLLLERDFPPDKWETALIEAETIAQELLERVSRIPTDDSPVIRELKLQAQRAAASHDYDRAELLLRRIRGNRREARYKLATEEAEAAADIAAARVARLDYRGASDLYREAAEVPNLSTELQWHWRERQATVLLHLGREFGDHDALQESIALFRETVLPLAPKRIRPDDWCQTRNGLGIALQTLGERTDDTRPLEEAIAMYRRVLDIRSRDRAPLSWSKTMNDLGNALSILGRRTMNEAHLREATDAYRAALQARPREGAPLDWATTRPISAPSSQP